MFLDRDGTLTEPRHYPSHPDDLVLKPLIGPPLRALRDAGFALVVVTNQSALARGLVDEATIDTMQQRLRDLLAAQRIYLDGIFYCPHHVGGTVPRFAVMCSCRKPAPGMLHQAADELGLDLSASWMIGDSACDIDAGRRAGTRTALIARLALPGVAPTLHRTTTVETLAHIAAAGTDAS